MFKRNVLEVFSCAITDLKGKIWAPDVNLGIFHYIDDKRRHKTDEITQRVIAK